MPLRMRVAQLASWQTTGYRRSGSISYWPRLYRSGGWM